MTISVLVVDDDADIRSLAGTIIQTANEGLELRGTAGSGPEAISLADQVDPKVIVLDVMMPGMNGFECAARLRQTRPEQRILLFSAFAGRELQREADDLGLGKVLPKDSITTLPELIRAVADA